MLSVIETIADHPSGPINGLSCGIWFPLYLDLVAHSCAFHRQPVKQVVNIGGLKGDLGRLATLIDPENDLLLILIQLDIDRFWGGVGHRLSLGVRDRRVNGTLSQEARPTRNA